MKRHSRHGCVSVWEQKSRRRDDGRQDPFERSCDMDSSYEVAVRAKAATIYEVSEAERLIRRSSLSSPTPEFGLRRAVPGEPRPLTSAPSMLSCACVCVCAWRARAQEMGFGHIDRTLSLLEAALRTETSPPSDLHHVVSLLPTGSLSLTGGPLQPTEPPSEAVRRRHMPAKAPRYGHPEGYTPMGDRLL